MKKVVLGILVLGIMLFGLTGCTNESIANNSRFVKVYSEGKYEILVDTRTNVEYIAFGGFRCGGGITMLVNQDGTPLLYGGE